MTKSLTTNHLQTPTHADTHARTRTRTRSHHTPTQTPPIYRLPCAPSPSRARLAANGALMAACARLPPLFVCGRVFSCLVPCGCSHHTHGTTHDQPTDPAGVAGALLSPSTARTNARERCALPRAGGGCSAPPHSVGRIGWATAGVACVAGALCSPSTARKSS